MSKPLFSDLFTLHGRRNRKSYFFYALLVGIAIGILAGLGAAAGGMTAGSMSGAGPIIILDIVLAIVVIVAAISIWIVGAQRCRDFGWSGWAIFLTLIPFVGTIFAIAILFVPGTQGPNRYGPDPLQVSA